MAKFPHLRIIGGTHKRQHVYFDTRTNPNLRPTGDRIRETVFNWLGQDLTGRICLDLFAGTGALGFEAASRNAHEAHLIETDKSSCHLLVENQQRLKLSNVFLHRMMAAQYLAQTALKFDIVFIDPPFLAYQKADFLPALLHAVAPLLTASGLIYLEAPAVLALPEPWNWIKQSRAGRVYFGLASPHFNNA